MPASLSKYAQAQTYDWNYQHAPDPVDIAVPPYPGSWNFCGLPVASPLGVPAGPLLNGRWVRYYASLGFDVLTYKTVRSVERACYPLPNLQPIQCGQLRGGETSLPITKSMQGSWAVSFGMPSQSPNVWRADIEQTRKHLDRHQLLSVSVVGTVQPDWSTEQLADDYAQCAAWAVESGADCIEANLSCPNVATCDGQLYHHPEDSACVAERIRAAIGGRPLILKVGHIPETRQATDLLRQVAPHATAIAVTNSIATTVMDDRGKLLFGGERRGICGAATFEASVAQTAMLHDIIQREKLELQLVGVGGVRDRSHVEAYLAAGAHAVQIATAAMLDPLVAIKIRRG
jgi:dihydroorotate dehydrogenase